MSSRAIPETRSTTLVPVPTTEEVPVLTDRERASLAASIAAAKARIEAGDFFEYDPDTFKGRLLETYRAARAARQE